VGCELWVKRWEAKGLEGPWEKAGHENRKHRLHVIVHGSLTTAHCSLLHSQLTTRHPQFFPLRNSPSESADEANRGQNA
jgi:hypothetical protein